MPSTTTIWNPDDWEIFALGLLNCRHGVLNVHKVPAKDQGDLGIDYYCNKESVAYQCYAVEEPIGVAERAKKQKDKITKDLGKLQKNYLIVSKLFLGAPIKRWVLLSPLHDSKDVNIHCANKTTELRSKALPYLDTDFEVLIHDQAFFGADALTLNAAQLSLIKLSIPNPTNPQISSWEKEEGSQDLLSTARTKLAKRTTPQKLEDAVADATRYHLQGAALMSALRSQAPELHDNLATVIASRRRHLEFAGPTAVTASGILNDEIMNLKEAIKGAAPNLSPENIDQLVFGTISEWIMQCPLDFPNVP
ncbi:hypothetical protein P7F60_28380 [Rhizobium sp. YJ-22]|uniref:hypothetical protein n=1 Tax=Rhizobium sp. YJ-22 TaxID=3037556 RepID=UPI0024127D2E|nr:hypothetical protein [Rhizobium sp. YJ-22]MDG3580302.1 hypothetical protein [Rhizobium sp. YJ-22]